MRPQHIRLSAAERWSRDAGHAQKCRQVRQSDHVGISRLEAGCVLSVPRAGGVSHRVDCGMRAASSDRRTRRRWCCGIFGPPGAIGPT